MAISEFHASTIVKVRAYFGFSEFACDPAEITRTLSIDPDEVGRKGEVRRIVAGREIRHLWNEWGIASRSDSKDINDHLRELLVRLKGAAGLLREEFGPASFSVLWKGNDLCAGSGPFYEADVIAGVASFRAMHWQDIFQVDEDDEPKVERVPL